MMIIITMGVREEKWKCNFTEPPKNLITCNKKLIKLPILLDSFNVVLNSAHSVWRITSFHFRCMKLCHCLVIISNLKIQIPSPSSLCDYCVCPTNVKKMPSSSCCCCCNRFKTNYLICHLQSKKGNFLLKKIEDFYFFFLFLKKNVLFHFNILYFVFSPLIVISMQTRIIFKTPPRCCLFPSRFCLVFGVCWGVVDRSCSLLAPLSRRR